MHDIYRGHHHDPVWTGNVPKPVTVGIGGPVGSGKTALVDRLCKALRDTYRLAVVTNDIYTREDAEFLTRSGALFEVIKKYIEENASLPLTRENVAKRFHITPNYLSHLFRKSGDIGFSEYLNHVRLEKAKLLLKGYELKIKEVATSSGFVDSNYFCRVFRKSTARSPSEYRSQWLSQLSERKS